MKPGRNDPCPCGSGKKHKKCCHDKLEIRSGFQPLLQQAETAPHRAPSQHEIGTLVLLFNQQRYIEAESLARAMTKNFPHDAFGWKVLGAVFQQMGRNADALAPMQKAAALSPNDAEAHYNLGVALQFLGQLDGAETSYRRALKINPGSPEILNNLAALLLAQGAPIKALSIIYQSLNTEEKIETKKLFVECVKHLQFIDDNTHLRDVMVRALSEPWGRPHDLAQIATDLIMHNRGIGESVARAAEAWPQRLSAQSLFGTADLTMIDSDPLLCALLVSTPICNMELERFLTMVRQVLLNAATDASASEGKDSAAMRFYCALAQQCFINEYVFAQTDVETDQANTLRNLLIAALKTGTQIPDFWLVAVAAYFPLHYLPLASRLLERQWPEEVAAVLKQQVLEPAEEQQLRATIPRLTNIENEVSLLVQSQYEENPYPRWVRIVPAGEAMNIVGYLCQKFPTAYCNRHDKSGSIEALIAGCGTGQQPIEMVQDFQMAHVLAVDLSISSLCYAKRKTRELGLNTIEYAQADLLKLGSLGRSFDIIESVGVLHHLADPWAGWRVLLSLLRPEGFMRLGFYSDVARRNIVKARAFIAGQGYGTTANEIRRCRQDLADLDKTADFGNTLKSSDFFSISTCRDLLFHVQEHRMTLAGIDAFLRENNLAFLGFEIGDDVLRAYKLRFPEDYAATNLDQWQIFENENPDTFFGMYQFWVQEMGGV